MKKRSKSKAFKVHEKKQPPNKTFSHKIWRWIIAIGSIIAIPAGIAEMTGYSIIDIFNKRKVDSFTLTVLVHGKEGKDDLILKDQGKVIMDIGISRPEASINDKGEATFKELPSGYIGKRALISIKHPQPYFPVDRNREYELKEDKSIYLEVELKGINKVQGRVIDFENEQPLDNVRISYKGIATQSDGYGWYELNIPPEMQAKFIKMNFYKEGYKLESIDSIAPHTQQEVEISLRKIK